jgi:hypothetical protein
MQIGDAGYRGDCWPDYFVVHLIGRRNSSLVLFPEPFSRTACAKVL